MTTRCPAGFKTSPLLDEDPVQMQIHVYILIRQTSWNDGPKATDVEPYPE